MAKEATIARTSRKKAQDVAEQMSDEEIVAFCDAMQWDSTEDILLLRNKVEAEAETNYDFFNDLVAAKKIEYLSSVKQALDRGIIAHDPGGNKFIWSSNNQVIAILTNVSGVTAVEQFSEWLQAGGSKTDEVFKKIKNLLESQQKKQLT